MGCEVGNVLCCLVVSLWFVWWCRVAWCRDKVVFYFGRLSSVFQLIVVVFLIVCRTSLLPVSGMFGITVRTFGIGWCSGVVTRLSAFENGHVPYIVNPDQLM
ncbi:hypothetical protein QBC32DRAFT_334365 [Pseudoneurospora amorphoporcata]|uniref:Transmembrane protein n=1 Tax=Pseudoneurospora amorphoporcata TaxID=241081 RepID=A0AAN6NZW7_9PEZI|nr:hypothetical protein QBC32DRAFT_334365 [Pseudoneurospora amorphoporcata]